MSDARPRDGAQSWNPAPFSLHEGIAFTNHHDRGDKGEFGTGDGLALTAEFIQPQGSFILQGFGMGGMPAGPMIRERALGLRQRKGEKPTSGKYCTVHD